MSQSTLAVCLRGQERSGFASSLRFMSCHPHEAMIRSISLTPQTPWNYRVFLAYLRWYSNIRSPASGQGKSENCNEKRPKTEDFRLPTRLVSLRLWHRGLGGLLCAFPGAGALPHLPAPSSPVNAVDRFKQDALCSFPRKTSQLT